MSPLRIRCCRLRLGVCLAALLCLLTIIPGKAAIAVAGPLTTSEEPAARLTTFRARVLEVGEPVYEDLGYGMIIISQEVSLLATSGPLRGATFTVVHSNPGDPVYDIVVTPGINVVVSGYVEDGRPEEMFIEDVARDLQLGWLLAGLVLLLVALGGRRGIKSVLTLGVTVLLIVRVMLPRLLAGASPVGTSVAVAVIATLVTLTAVGGLGRKTLAAIIGTTGGVLVAGLLAALMSSIARLTGLGADESRMLLYIPQGTQFDLRGLLFAGMLIGALGAVMDVGMSVASAMAEVRLADPSIKRRRLVAAGMNVGRDIMGTMANTLVLAYTGAAIPMLLIFMAHDVALVRLLSLDVVATEVVRALAGTIGLVLAIPITALAGGLLLTTSTANIPADRGLSASRRESPPAEVEASEA